MNSHPQSIIRDGLFSRPLRHRLCPALKSNPMISPRIVRLFYGRRPVAIVWRVGPVILLALNRMLRTGAWPHIFVKGRKRLTPSITHCDATSAIIRKIRVSRVHCPASDMLPRFIFYRLVLSRCHAVLRRTLYQLFHFPAAATLGSSPSKPCSCCNFLISTVAPTQELSVPRWGVFKLAQDHQSTEPLPRKNCCGIYSFSHHEIHPFAGGQGCLSAYDIGAVRRIITNSAAYVKWGTRDCVCTESQRLSL